MTPRRLLIFSIAAVLAVAIALFVAHERTESKQGSGGALYPDLKTQADSVNAIRIFKAGEERALEILRENDRWTLTERHGYPIAAAKARNLVRALANATILEEKTSDGQRYADLGVEDVSGADATGVRIELEGPATPVNLIVGKDAPGGKSSYVRRAGEQQSWLVNEQLSASPEPKDWLDKNLVNITADRIQSASITIGTQKPYSATKSSRADADFKVEPLPKGKELSSPSAANGAATALSNLSLDDVLPKAEIANGKPSAHATYRTFDGLVIDLNGFEKDDQHYLTLTTSFDAKLADTFKVKTAADESKEENATATEATKSEPATPNVEEEAQKIAAKVGNWAYEIPGYKYDALFRPLDELLKK